MGKKKSKNNLIPIEEISNVINRAISTTRQYKNWGLFRLRSKVKRQEYFLKDEVEKAWEMFEEYIIKPEYKNNVKKACEDIGKDLYS